MAAPGDCRGRALDSEVVEVLGDLFVLVHLASERAPVVGAPGDALAAGGELGLVAVDGRLEPDELLRDELAAGIEEGARANASELLALCGAQAVGRWFGDDAFKARGIGALKKICRLRHMASQGFH
jgi:hypothetical protein